MIHRRYGHKCSPDSAASFQSTPTSSALVYKHTSHRRKSKDRSRQLPVILNRIVLGCRYSQTQTRLLVNQRRKSRLRLYRVQLSKRA